jgi:hypothetical protein
MFNLSPKVTVPFVTGLIAFAVTWVSTGSFDGPTLAVLLATFGYAVLGVAAPPAPLVKQAEVNALSRQRR